MEFHAGAFFICAHRVSGVGTYFGFGVPLNAPHDVPSIDAAPPPAAVFQHPSQAKPRRIGAQSCELSLHASKLHHTKSTSANYNIMVHEKRGSNCLGQGSHVRTYYNESLFMKDSCLLRYFISSRLMKHGFNFL